MGFFNFIYKLTIIFSNKKKMRVFFIIAIIFLLIFCWTKGVFAAVTPEDTNALMNYQLQMQVSLVNYLRFIQQQQARGYDNSAFMDLLDKMYNFNVYVVAGNDGTNYTQFKVYTYSNRNDNNYNIFNVEGTYSLGLTSGTEYPCMLGLITPNALIDVVVPGNGRTTPVVNTNVTSFYMPDACYLVRSTEINQLLSDFGFYTKIQSTFNTRDEELQSITSSGFSSLNNNIQEQTNIMTNSINSASSSITNSINSVENTLTDTTTDDNQVEFASEENQDVTSGFFTNLFTIIQNNFTSNIYKVVSFPIPFTNKTMTFSNDYFTNNIYMNEKFSPLVNLARSCWWFSLGYFVILDIYKKINKLKSGDLTNIENENITTDLL